MTILQRHIELESQRRKIMTVVKMRYGDYSKGIRLYDVCPTGIVLGDTLPDHRGIITGVSALSSRSPLA